MSIAAIFTIILIAIAIWIGCAVYLAMRFLKPRMPQNSAKPSHKNILPLIAFWIFWGLLGLAAGNMVFGASGICLSQARYWKDEELIMIAVRTNANQGLIGTHSGMAIDDSEKSVLKFLKDNPNCCKIDRSPISRGLLDFLVGWNAPWVEINYPLHPIDRPEQGDKYYKKFFIVNTCGEALGMGAGTSTFTLETVR